MAKVYFYIFVILFSSLGIAQENALPNFELRLGISNAYGESIKNTFDNGLNMQLNLDIYEYKIMTLTLFSRIDLFKNEANTAVTDNLFYLSFGSKIKINLIKLSDSPSYIHFSSGILYSKISNYLTTESDDLDILTATPVIPLFEIGLNFKNFQFDIGYLPVSTKIKLSSEVLNQIDEAGIKLVNHKLSMDLISFTFSYKFE